MAFPCCARPRGLDDKDAAGAMIGVAQPLHPGTSVFGVRDRNRDAELRALGPNEGGGGAFLKLRGELEARQAESLGKWADRPRSPAVQELRKSGSLSPPPNGVTLLASPGPQPSPGTQSGVAEGWMGGLSNSVAGLGASLGLASPPTTPPTAAQPAGILKNADQLPAGGDSFTSEASKRSSGSGFSATSRPSSLRGDITGRRFLSCASLLSCCAPPTPSR